VHDEIGTDESIDGRGETHAPEVSVELLTRSYGIVEVGLHNGDGFLHRTQRIVVDA